MACRDAYKNSETLKFDLSQLHMNPVKNDESVTRLLFGAYTNSPLNTILQNNLEMFEWIKRNKVYPCFVGRSINGDTPLTIDEIDFIHGKGCLIAPVYVCSDEKATEEQGLKTGDDIIGIAHSLGIPQETAFYLKINDEEKITRDYLRGFAISLLLAGYTPAFMANTDAKYDFDREYSRGVQTDKEIFLNCLIWATSPSIKEYDNITTTHLIHPDNWVPFAPSGITRRDIAIWRYGKNCHKIEDNKSKVTSFDVNLVRNANIITEKMF